MKKKSQVVMLPTNKKATDKPFSTGLTLCNDGILRIGNPVGSTESRQELYFLSDEKIEIGDWALNFKKPYFNIVQCNKSNKESIQEHWKKIIATTDNKLSINLGLEKWIAPTNSNDDLVYTRLAPYPQPSPQFIQKFIKVWNKGNKIEWVNVEYEAIGNWRHAEFVHTRDIPKVDKNNYITITKIKDSFTMNDLKQAFYAGSCSDVEGNWLEQFNTWTEENL